LFESILHIKELRKGALQKAPFLFICLYLIIGILIYSYTSIRFSVSHSLYIIIGSIVFIKGLSFLLANFKLQLYFLWFLIFASVYPNLFANKYEPLLGAKYGTFRIVSAPQEKNKTFAFEIETYKQNKTELVSKAIIYVQKDSLVQLLSYGDVIQCKAIFKEISNVDSSSFDYKKWMAKKYIYSSAYVPSKNIIKVGEESSITSFAVKTQLKALDLFKTSGINQETFEVISALVLGNKSFLQKETKLQFAKAGAMHVLAVSGLHVGIVSSIIYMILHVLFRKRFLLFQLVVVVSSIWLFAFITGLSVSVQRAAIMFSLFSVSLILKRQTSAYNTLAAAAFISILINPFVIFDVGFQLSYIAVLSILYFSPFLIKLFRFKFKLLKYFWGIIAVSIAVNIGTIGISSFYFEVLPGLSLLSNIVVIPLAFVVIALGLLFIIPLIQPYLVAVVDYVLVIFRSLIGWFSTMEYGQFNYKVSIIELIIFYSILLLSIIYIELSKKKKELTAD